MQRQGTDTGSGSSPPPGKQPLKNGYFDISRRVMSKEDAALL
jgi:hypothetical protein